MSVESIRERLAAATPGPWEAYVPAEDDDYVEWWVWQTAARPYYGGVLHVQGHEDDTRRGEIGSADITDGSDKERERKDAEFIAASRTDIDLLLAVVEAAHEWWHVWALGEVEDHARGEFLARWDALESAP